MEGNGQGKRGNGIALVVVPQRCRGSRMGWGGGGSRDQFNWGWTSKILGSEVGLRSRGTKVGSSGQESD